MHLDQDRMPRDDVIVNSHTDSDAVPHLCNTPIKLHEGDEQHGLIT